MGTSKNLFPTSASPYFSMVEFVESGVFRSSQMIYYEYF
jgi:hypothetical protein